MHWYVDFRDPVRRAGADPRLSGWPGGVPELPGRPRLLYEKHGPADDLLAPVFAAMAPELPQREAAVFAEAFGGPPADGSADDGADDGAAARPALSEDQRARWVAPALRAADETMLPADPQFRGALTSFLQWASRVPHAAPPAWDWGPAGPPAEEPAQASAVDDHAAIPLPGPAQPVTFQPHIQP